MFIVKYWGVLEKPRVNLAAAGKQVWNEIPRNEKWVDESVLGRTSQKRILKIPSLANFMEFWCFVFTYVSRGFPLTFCLFVLGMSHDVFSFIYIQYDFFVEARLRH